uniref:BTB domain-containing protein n=1 Tax=Oryza glaberrima TaxID=4538 RepID=I1QUQ0_ORYGL
MGQCAMSHTRSATTAGAGGKPPIAPPPTSSASAIVADTASGYHLFKINDYSRTKDIFPTGSALKSRAFTIGGHQWRIHYYPNGNTEECGEYISLFLHLDEIVTDKNVYAQHGFRLFDEFAGDNDDDDELQPSSIADLGQVSTFGGNNIGLGRLRFIKREELEKSKYLKNDSFTVRCDVVVTKRIRSEETPLVVRTSPKPKAARFVTVPPSDLHRHLQDLLCAEKGADVVFEAGGETFTAHRCVLAARSPVFSAELFGSMKESDTSVVIRIDDMEAQVFKALLFFVYTDSLPETKKEDEYAMCQHLLVAADRYNMERLKLICEDRLCSYIGVGTVTTILELAEQHNCDGLKKACFDFLSSRKNLKAVTAGEGLEHLGRNCPSLVNELIATLGNLIQ